MEACHFGLKTAEHSIGKCIERVFQKNSLKLNAASHNNTSWYTGTDGFLEHSPSGGSLYYKAPALQKVILVLGGSSLHIRTHTHTYIHAGHDTMWGDWGQVIEVEGKKNLITALNKNATVIK